MLVVLNVAAVETLYSIFCIFMGIARLPEVTKQRT